MSPCVYKEALRGSGQVATTTMSSSQRKDIVGGDRILQLQGDNNTLLHRVVSHQNWLILKGEGNPKLFDGGEDLPGGI